MTGTPPPAPLLHRAFIPLAVSVALGFGLVGCSASTPVPSKSDLVGIWSHLHGLGRLQIEADGRFVLTGVPRGVITESPVSGEGATIEPAIDGRWTFGAGAGGVKTDAEDGPVVELQFSSPPVVADRGAIFLNYDIVNQKPELYVYLGDPDNAALYTWTKTG